MFTLLKPLVLGAAFALLAGTAVTARGQAPPGLKVGEKAPAFALRDQDGKARSLDDLLKGGPGKVALVFYRSADW